MIAAMIEATCPACGTLNRIAEPNVPVGAKSVACASCKTRIPLNTGPATPGSTLDLTDLPAPKSRASLGPAGAPAKPAGAPPRPVLSFDDDLPAPKPTARAAPPSIAPPPGNGPLNLDDFLAPAEPDLPAPKLRGRPTDLPATRASEDILDLPAPKSSRGVTDLPTPKNTSLGLKEPTRGGGVTDLPAPRGAGVTDLPTPRGISDLPAPRGIADLPTPKGPARSTLDLPTPKRPGGGTDLLTPKRDADLLAPKGFFDDLPQPARNQPAASNNVDLPAPLGFFDDLPQRSRNQGSQDLPAPLGFFDDLPMAKGVEPQLPVPKGHFENLPQPTTTPARPAPEEGLDLASYNDMDISKPSTPPSRYEQSQAPAIRTPQPTGQTAIGQSTAAPLNTADGLELIHDPSQKRTNRNAPKVKESTRPVEATVAPQSHKKLLSAIVAGAVLLGGGGFILYRRHVAAEERQDLINQKLAIAQTSLVTPTPGHWLRAQTAATKVLEIDEANPRALEIAAEASFAGAIDEGTNSQVRIGLGRKRIGDALANGVSGPPLARAQGLNAITMGQFDISIAKLTPLLAGSTDGFIALYLGWAQSAKGDLPAAIAAFDQVIKLNKALAPAGLYGRGKAKLASGDLDGARADFTAILDQSKDHIGAQVGLAAAMPATKAAQQEADLLAILQRKDIATADPRVVINAWVLAGDSAARGARLDAARERYRKALEISPDDVNALTGLAETEMKDGKLETALGAIVKALNLAKDDARAQIVATELAIKQSRLDDADSRIIALTDRQPPLPRLDAAHLLLAKGHLLEARHKTAEAIDAYVASAKLAGDLDLTPTMLAVSRLAATGQQDRAGELLAGLEGKADSDPLLALTLGNGYLQAGIYDQAERWLRKASDARPSDPDAMFQLAKATAKLGHTESAIAQLKKAIEIDPARSELGLELAVTYEDAGRDSDALAIYEKLLAGKEVSLELRGRAGRFFARTGDLARAAQQAVPILQIQPTHPAGLYLKGVGLLAEGKADEARKAFHAAAAQDHEPQYFDGEGQAAEKEIEQTGDTKWQEVALNVYHLAHKGAPKMFNPLAGAARLYVARREWKKAAEDALEAFKLKEDGDVAFMIGVSAQELLDKVSAMQWLKRAQDLKQLPEASHRLGMLYIDANDSGNAIAALQKATQGAEDENKRTGKPAPKWLAEAYYYLGSIEQQVGHLHQARIAYQRFLDSEPPVDGRVTAVRDKLNTSLRGQ